MSKMSTKNRAGKLWLSPLLEDDPAHDSPPVRTTDHQSAHYGLVATCADKLQGTYMVRNKTGAQWLVAKGVDDIFDIIVRPTDRVSTEPLDERIITAVKAYITRNERQE
jgi:hypothetical protein